MENNRATLEVIAPTIEEAVEKGLSELGLTREDIDVEVLDEGSTGLLGIGSRQARVLLIVGGKSTPEPARDPAPQVEIVPERTSTETRPEEVVPKVAVQEEEEVSEDQHLVNLSQQVVQELLDKMKVDAEIESYLGEPYGPHNRVPIHVDIFGDDLSILIGHRGETLDALQYIVRLILGKELEKAIPLVIDIEGYRKRREEQIRRLTRRVAEQVVQTGRSQSLEPMPANERRVSHVELQDDPRVYTESTGSGKKRKVVIYLSD